MKFRSRTLTALSFGLNVVILGALSLFTPSVAQAETAAGVRGSVFFPPKLMETARANAAKDPWAARMQKALIESPAPWMKYTDDELWEMMFGNTIKRAWMVWSNGYCPACKKDVPMYNWTTDPLAHPWKMRCPHCQEYFPKNDFAAFYRSGLDAHNIFDPKLADRRLLFNSDHPDPKDPLYRFGVDDGEGYVEGDKRWRFVGAYTIRGQWKIAVLVGIQSLASAYTVTGDKAYAHKALILLDRVADLYPTFDYKKQGTVYERAGVSDGYVSVWHDACSETRILAEAYDRVRGELNNDPELVSFLAAKAKKFGLSNPKSSPDDIRRNIEDRILRDALEHREKTDSNYPQTDMTFVIMKTVLGWPDNRKEVETAIDQMIEKSAAFDGLSGEKGLAAYSSFSPQAIAQLLGMYSRIDPSFLKNALKRHPRLYQMFRFYIDTCCLNRYYPDVGDSGAFGTAIDRYLGVGFSQWPGLNPSMYSFMGQLYQATGDPDFALEVYNGNGGSTKDLPFDLFASNPPAFQKMIGDVIAKKGRYPKVSSVNKQEWHLGILRSGKDADARALWMQYDSVGTHGHANGMNLGLYAKGLDLMPEFGYPPVQFGGWDSPRATWYTISAAHNTVVVDGLSHRPSEMSGIGVAKTAAKTTLWADGSQFHAIRASSPEMIAGKQFERTAVLCDLSDRDFYVLDIFRVVGGTDHAKFLHSSYGQITTRGLTLAPASEYGHGAQMRNFRADQSPLPGWNVDWKIDDRNHYLAPVKDVRMRYIDLTPDAQGWTAEDWVMAGSYNSSEEAWIPSAITRRQSTQSPLASTFISIIEPYEKTSNLSGARRLPLETPDGIQYPESNAAVEVVSANGCHDLFIAADVENPLSQTPSRASDKILVQKESGVRTDGDLCMVRRMGGGVQKIALCRGSVVIAGNVALRMKKRVDYVEIRLNQGRPILIAGNAGDVQSITVGGKNIWRSAAAK